MEDRLDPSSVEAFLRERYGDIRKVTPLVGGDWSTAYGFVADGEDLVVRFGNHIEDYEKDRMASSWSRAGLPIPEIVDVGRAFEGSFAISRLLSGTKLDELPAERLAIALESLIESLIVLSRVALPGNGFGGWEAPFGDAPHRRWSEFLVAIPQRDEVRLRGWRELLAKEPEARAVFNRVQGEIEMLAASCPDVRRVIHSDLLYGNVLVDSNNEISGIFDWGNSIAGDPLYDLAWLIFWAPWHPGIDADRVRSLAASRFNTDDIELRLRCYQLHIALDSMQYQAFAGLRDDLHATAQHTQSLL